VTNHVKDKVIVITGAASGFGRLVAQKSAALGAKVICADIDATGLDETVAGIVSAGGTALAQVTDVTDLPQMQALAQGAVQQFSRIDVMVNNAGIMPLAFYRDHALAQNAWEKCIDINIKGVLNGIVSVHDQMLKQGRGHVINLSSIYGNFPVVGAGVYGATKAAVNFLSESLRMESQGKIKVTIVKPTGVPGTALGQGVINPEALVGILGHNMPTYGQLMQAHAAGELPAEHTDPQHIEYYALEPEHLAEQIVYAINQPWGVVIGDITVRASGDAYLL
jgi:NADP-dependent 3-hydroxy acid dehydrogenase YdfG